MIYYEFIIFELYVCTKHKKICIIYNVGKKFKKILSLLMLKVKQYYNL